MGLPVVDPLSRGWDRMKFTLLRRPVDVGKWFGLGFCFWLTSLADGGFNTNFNSSSGSGPAGPGPSPFDEFRRFAADHLSVVVMVALAVLVVVIALYLVFLWLSARGRFMALDGLRHNRGNVVAPWKQFRRQANDFFFLSIAFHVTLLFMFLIPTLIAAIVAWPDLEPVLRGRAFVMTGASLAGILIFLPTLLVSVLVSAYAGTLLNDFAPAIMVVRDLRAWPAFKLAAAKLLRGNFWSFTGFLILRFLVMLACGIVYAIAGLLTCCIGLIVMVLPYIGTVAMLPIFVFHSAYALHYLEQLGPDFIMFPAEIPPPGGPPLGGFPVIMDPDPNAPPW